MAGILGQSHLAVYTIGYMGNPMMNRLFCLNVDFRILSVTRIYGDYAHILGVKI